MKGFQGWFEVGGWEEGKRPEGSRVDERSLRALYLVDGEHHPSTVRDAVERLRRVNTGPHVIPGTQLS